MPADPSNENEPPVLPAEPTLQFSLRTILLVIAAFCVLFAVLAALGINGMNVMIAFAVTSGTALLAIVSVEIFKGIRRGP